MEKTQSHSDPLDQHLALRLKSLRTEQTWSLDELSRRSGISRATLSRLENAEVSPTASVLGKLCAAYGLTVSRLMRMVEAQFEPLIRPDAQAVWADPQHGFRRRSVSPPAATLAAEVLLCELDPGAQIHYEASPRPGLEHHLVLQEGQLRITVDGHTYALQPGDCLRYQLHGASAFETPADTGARYHLFIV